MDKLKNNTAKSIIGNCFLAFISLFFNGLGVFLMIHANIGASPWDVLNLGISNTLGISYGNASISVSLIILIIDVLLKEPIGLAMFIDAFTVGKAVDFFGWTGLIPVPKTMVGSIVMMFIGIVIASYTQYGYMIASLGCGPRDTLLVGLKKHFARIPIGVVSIVLLSCATLTGFLLGGQVGMGTLISAFCTGPIMQKCFESVGFDAAAVRHQSIKDSVKVMIKK